MNPGEGLICFMIDDEGEKNVATSKALGRSKWKCKQHCDWELLKRIGACAEGKQARMIQMSV
jgi:hypothetical protein